MANNFLEAAFIFKTGTEENAKLIAAWLAGRRLPEPVKEAALHDMWDEEDFDEQGDLHTGFALTREAPDGGGLWVGVGQASSFDVVVVALNHAMQTLPEVPSPQGFEWAFWCDQLRTGQFGGGAIVLRRNEEPKIFSTSEWLRDETRDSKELD